MSQPILREFKQNLQKNVARLAYNSLLYGWSLSGDIPRQLLLKPADLWPGQAEKGRWLIHGGIFTLSDDQLELHNANWHPEEVSDAWIRHLHGFDWLRDLRALGGNAGRLAARAMIESWMDHHHGWHELYWRPDILGRRIAAWLTAYDFYGESASAEFQERLFLSLSRQVRHLARALPGSLSGLPLLHAVRGLTFAGVALESREAQLEQALNLLDREIDRQVSKDGGGVTRHPGDMMEILKILIDLRATLRQAGFPPLDKIQSAIDRMVPALRFFRHGDGKFALFNGAQEGEDDTIKYVLLQSGARARTISSLPKTGYERIALGKSILIMDTGRAPAYPYDVSAHCAPLAFEWSYGRDRVFVNCGSHPTQEDWQDALRATPAHNALTIDHRNVCEIHRDGSLSRKPKKIVVNREEKSGGILIDACHDGYLPLSGITHRRRIFMGDQGHDIRGEDNLTCSVGLGRVHTVSVRFHVHPRVTGSLVNDGKDVLLRLPSGTGWRVSCEGATLALDDSVYLGDGTRPRKTKQIVLTTLMDSDFKQIKWVCQKE
jgi:uncharacterized heparinase superfamily protein